MSTERFPFSVNAEMLLAMPVSEALNDSEKLESWHYGQVFYQKAKEAETDDKSDVEIAWRLLGQLAQIMLREGNADEPFQPIAKGADGRSILPVDLDDASADAVRQLGMAVEDVEFQARLLDITWNRLRDPESARRAVQAYLDSAKRLFDPEHWIPYVQRAERALRLARQLKDNKLCDAVLDEIEQRVVQLDGGDPLYMTSRLMRLLHEFRRGDPNEMSRIAQKAAEAAAVAKDFGRVRSHLENHVCWRRIAQDNDGEREAKTAVANTYEQEADVRSDDPLVAAHHLQKAHEAYRNIPGTRKKTEEVYGKLREAQERATNALKEIQTDGIDITEAVQDARQHVTGKSFEEALLALATVTRPLDFEKETRTALELAAEFPLQGLFGGVKMDRDGRVVAHKTPGIGGGEAQEKQALWERVVEQISMSQQLDTQARIGPAINQLVFEHSPSLRDMQDFVVHNPFVPQGHEEVFAKGFLAGLRGNFPEALSILVPQLENSLRHILAQTGAEVTTRDKHGVQSVIQMGTILSDRGNELEPMMGADLVKSLKVLFSDQHGPDIRNRIAHGLMKHDDFYSASAIYAWWIIFFLCISPVYSRFQKKLE